MSNLHNPARQDGESQADYRERRLASKRAHQRITHTGPFKPETGQSRRDQRRDARKSGDFIAGSYGKGLRTAITRKQRDALEKRVVKAFPEMFAEAA